LAEKGERLTTVDVAQTGFTTAREIYEEDADLSDA